jgi:predicted kinase
MSEKTVAELERHLHALEGILELLDGRKGTETLAELAERAKQELEVAKAAEALESRWVLLLRGLPGSGKSTFAKAQPDSVIVSASDYFHFPRGPVPRVEGPIGEHDYDHSESRHSHDYCLRKFIQIVQSRDRRNIIVDNTNTNPFSMAPYIGIARAYGLSVRIIEFVADLHECHARQRHDVPKHVMLRMDFDLHGKLPTFWPSPERVHTGRDASATEKAHESAEPKLPEDTHE